MYEYKIPGTRVTGFVALHHV